MARHGGKILADHLVSEGVTRVFSVPGESFLAALDGLHDSGIQNIVCRQEGGAAMMAEAHGKLTGKPGVLFVTRGPGATNASSGIHVARQDSTPMVVFVGQIAREHRDREAFQEVDYKSFFGSVAKWVAEVDQTDRLPEYLARAFHVAQSGRPGPVVLALPEDMLSAVADVSDRTPMAPSLPSPTDQQATAILDAIAASSKPLVIAGGPGWSQSASDNLCRFAAANSLPVAVTFRRQDFMDNRHPNYVGDLGVGMNPALAARLKEADTLLVLGSRLGDIPTGGYALINPAASDKTIIHIHPDADELGRVFHAEIAVPAPAPAMLDILARTNGTNAPSWAQWAESARADYEAWQTPKETPGAVKMEGVVTWLSAHLPDDAVLTNGAGNFAAWLHRYYRFRQHGTQLAPTSGSMGYGFPAAIAASLHHPETPVVCIAGDGDFQMTLNEFSTAMQHGAHPVVIVANNGRYGTIRMHQERQYPGRVSGTFMANPDFAALARAYGGHGETVETTDAFPAAFARAQASGKPAVIELRLDAEALSTAMTLSEARAAGLRQTSGG